MEKTPPYKPKDINKLRLSCMQKRHFDSSLSTIVTFLPQAKYVTLQAQRSKMSLSKAGTYNLDKN
jgi:hypothetical protein